MDNVQINLFSFQRQDINLFRDIYNNIFEYLSYIDKLALLYANPRIYDCINKDFLNPEKIIKEEFKKFEINYDIFYSRFLQNSPDLNGKNFGNTVLFGGILLGIITSNIYFNSDLDFVHFSYKDGMFCPIKNIIFRNPNASYISNYHHQSKESDEHDEIKVIDWTTYDFLNYPAYLIKMEAMEGRIHQHNTLLHKTKSLLKYLDKHCDYDFTKIVYDGKKIRIKNMDSIFKKSVKLNFSEIFKNDIQFRSGGIPFFAFNEKFPYDILMRIEQRVKKYTKKGYNIEFENQIFRAKDILRDLVFRYDLNLIGELKIDKEPLNPFKPIFLHEGKIDNLLLKNSATTISNRNFKKLCKKLKYIIDKHDLCFNKKISSFIQKCDYYFIHYLFEMYKIKNRTIQYLKFFLMDKKIFEPYSEEEFEKYCEQFIHF